MSELITLGEPLVVFASDECDVSIAKSSKFTKRIGGAELNVAIGTKRLGHSVQYITQVGEEPLGEYIAESLSKYGVGTDYVFQSDEYLTGHQFKQRVSHGDPDVANYRKDSAASHLSFNMIDQIDLTGVKIAHLTGIFPAISRTAQNTLKLFIQQLIDNHIFISFDTNLRPALWPSESTMIDSINEFAKLADIVLPGIHEGETLLGTRDPESIADYYLNNGRASAVVVKVGPKGSFVKTRSGHTNMISGFRVDKVVDTVGAGDGFALGVITALLEGKSIDSAALRGNAIGALQVQTPGDNDGYPTQDQLTKFYDSQGVSEEGEVQNYAREV
ncbi:sugar kinase [Lentilactobacillus buchneri]|uniref:sugar kinase n=1 Tax=Lentilactobacillus buchneri TaxID=1581 RepID=UPI0002075D97|nr:MULTISPECIES: sugar kinase [Lentilactobacillus]AEB72371.1 2-dehydro-3-deoxygluconokinase [Lentilactobacillus buchneri NRRL B-30929]MCV3742616.1 sugar kinase [Lentilactobacillus hilgardii]MDS1016592.1 sugar kinase [Lentilactobacillus buchneri]MQM59265.1 sugar kinase [Lentilactobacillus buchneri]MQM76628.1 sugar kinase [Lentilactobacillus buchneri]